MGMWEGSGVGGGKREVMSARERGRVGMVWKWVWKWVWIGRGAWWELCGRKKQCMRFGREAVIVRGKVY